MYLIIAPVVESTTVNASSNQHHVISCNFYGFPRPTLRWAFNGLPLNSAVFSVTQTHSTNTAGELVTTSNLSFFPDSIKFSGIYTCMVASNPLLKTNFQVNIQSKWNLTICIPESPSPPHQFQLKFFWSQWLLVMA